MAAANGSGDGVAPFLPSESDSDESFDGFDDGNIEEARNKIRGSELDRDSDDEVNSSEFEVGSDSDSDGVSDAGDDFLVDQPIQRGRGPARRRGRGAARGRGTGPGRGQTATPPWSTTLIDPPDIRYRRAENVGVVDSEQRRLFSPLQLFSLFFTEYILGDIVEQTNLYAQKCMAKPPRRGEAHLPWSALTVPELRTWIGLIFAMGVVQKVGRLAEYWSRHFYTSTPSLRQTMPCSRFMIILRYLHFIDNEDATIERATHVESTESPGLRLQTVSGVLHTETRAKCGRNYDKFKGLLNIKQYIKIKPVKWDVKLFTIAESATGYVLGLLPYTGKRPDTAFGKTTHTVLDVSDNFLHLGHRMYLDNYYMSLELVKALYDPNNIELYSFVTFSPVNLTAPLCYVTLEWPLANKSVC